MSEIPELLEQDLKAIYSNMFEQYQKTEKDLESYADTLLEWLKTQQHLPETDNRALVKKFLLLNKFSVERTKAKLDMYYTIRKPIPDMFQNPNTQNMIEQRRVCPIVVLPKLSKNLNRIIVVRVSDKYPPSKVNTAEMFANMFAAMEVLIKEDVAFQIEFVVDHAHAKIEHAAKTDLMAMKRCQTVLEKVFSNRVAMVHLVNVPSYFTTLINLVKKVLPAKIVERIHIHNKLDTLYEFYSRDMLPVELEGTGLSLDTLNDMWDKKFLEYADRFEELEKMEVDESLRAEPLENDDILGFHGNFKKLDVD